jgi:hypothetical protein
VANATTLNLLAGEGGDGTWSSPEFTSEPIKLQPFKKKKKIVLFSKYADTMVFL